MPYTCKVKRLCLVFWGVFLPILFLLAQGCGTVRARHPVPPAQWTRRGW